MSGSKKRRDPAPRTPAKSVELVDLERVVAGRLPESPNGAPAPNIILYVMGGGGAGPDRNPTLRDFPLITRKKGQSKEIHLARVQSAVEEAVAAGGTHLLVPREHADWLAAHPWLVEYFGAEHGFTE